MRVLMERAWAMPNSATFKIKPIRELIERYVSPMFVDPFARDSIFNEICAYTNDLNGESRTTHHVEALEFLENLSVFGAMFDGVLFDPPYSPRQISECYQNVGRKTHMKDTQSSFYSERKNAASHLIKPGGVAICCGWNSNGFGKTRGFALEEILIVAHGGAHNDTIVTVERKA